MLRLQTALLVFDIHHALVKSMHSSVAVKFIKIRAHFPQLNVSCIYSAKQILCAQPNDILMIKIMPRSVKTKHIKIHFDTVQHDLKEKDKKY